MQMKLVPNVGDTDRIVRGVLGIVLVLIGLFVPMTSLALQIILLVIGALLIVTAAIRFCPVYRLLGFSTKTKK